MHITYEADYAVRIVYRLLQQKDRVMPARTLAEETGVTFRFALKILNKLTLAGLIQSRKGPSGGYYIDTMRDEITLGHILECIDGPLLLSRCIDTEFDCSMNKVKGMCPFHLFYADLGNRIRKELYNTKIIDKITEEETK